MVGLVQSPLYIQYERGNTTLGSGRLDGFVYLTPQGFDVDYFTEVYVRFQQEFPLYSEDYDAFMDEKTSVWEEFADTQAQARYERLFEEGSQKLADAREELDYSRTLGERELENAKEQLEDARKQLEDGEKALADAREELAEGKAPSARRRRRFRTRGLPSPRRRRS